MLAAFTALEAKVRAIITELDTEGRDEYERLVAAVKAEAAADLAKVQVIADDLETGLEKAVQAAGPSVSAAVKAEVARAMAALAPLLSEAAHEI